MKIKLAAFVSKAPGIVLKSLVAASLLTIAGGSAKAAPALEVVGTTPAGPLPQVAGLFQFPGKPSLIYGSTREGGLSGCGTVFAMDENGKISPVASLSGYNGENPSGALTSDAGGSLLYGTARIGGSANVGTLFKTTVGGALSVLLHFDGATSGSNPVGGLVRGAEGNFYGATASGGAGGKGVVFKITPGGKRTTLASFNGANGEEPVGTLLTGSGSRVYGTTAKGGSEGKGTVFSIAPGEGLRILASLSNATGSTPLAGVVAGGDGNLYGTASEGGGVGGKGAVFRITPEGIVTPLAVFTGSNGARPAAPLFLAADGNFYGTTREGGANDKGTVFQMTPAGALTTLWSFTGGSDGAAPAIALMQAADGNLYGASDTAIFRIRFGPTPVTLPVTEVAYQAGTNTAGVTLNASVNPNGHNATVTFLYGKASNLLGASATAGAAIGSGTDPVPVATPLPGLDPATLYYYRAKTTAPTGIVQYGNILSFTTPAPPATVTSGAVTVTGTGATLNGTVNPNGYPVAYYFEYGTGESYGSSTPEVKVSGSGSLPVVGVLSDLAPATPYHWRLVARSTVGSPVDPVVSTADATLTTLTVPVFTPGDALITGSNITLSASVNPHGVGAENGGTTVHWEYGLASGKYKTATALQDVGDGTAPLLATAVIPRKGLRSAIYYYRLVVTNKAGTFYGAEQIFATQPPALVSHKVDPSTLSGTRAALTGSVDPNGTLTTAYFEYGPTTAYGSTTPAISIGAGSSAVDIAASLKGLDDKQVYHYRLVTTSSLGTFHSKDQVFTTPARLLVSSVALKGAAAPGVEGAAFDRFGPPAINDSDRVAFQATLAGTGVTAANNSGIWADGAAFDLGLIARTGGIAPGTGGAVFEKLGDPAYNNNEKVAFCAKLKTADGNKHATGIWSDRSGELSLVARSGAQAPGCPAGALFASFEELALPDEGGVLFLGTLAKGPGGVNKANNTGLWGVDDGGSLRLIVRTGDAVLVDGESKTIASLAFLTPPANVGAQTRSFNRSGQVIYKATYTDKTQSLNQVTAAATTLVAVRDGDAPLGGSQTAKFSAFGSPALNEAGHVAFQAALAGSGVTKSSNSGIWAENGEEPLALVARTGSPAPGADGALFAKLGDPVYNNGDQVAFRAALKVKNAASATGIWATTSGTLTLVARAGMQAPGCPAGAVFDSKFAELALPDQGGAVFLGTLVKGRGGVTRSNDTGLWAVDGDGVLRLVIRTGDELVVDGVPKRIATLGILAPPSCVGGQSRSFNAVGNLIYEVTYTDKTEGINQVQFLQ